MNVFLALLSFLPFQQPDRPIYIKEEIQFIYGDEIQNTTQREIWMSRKELRTDKISPEGDDISLIFVPINDVFYVINHTQKNYYYVLTGRGKDKMDLRLPLQGIASIKGGSFEKPSVMAYPTTQRNRISQWECEEFQLKYPNNYGVTTTVWTTKTPTPMTRRLKFLWYTAFGTVNLPTDVRMVINQLLRDLNGTPIRFVSTIEQEGMKVSTVSTVKEIKYRKLPEENFFGVPSDYELVAKNIDIPTKE